jgi:hypothetical protein
MTPMPTLRPLLLGILLAAPVLFGQAPKFSVPDTLDVKADLVYAQYGDKGLRLDLSVPKTTPACAILPCRARRQGWRATASRLSAEPGASASGRAFRGVSIYR